MPPKVSFMLDGKKVEADKGLTIWEIANGQGIKIPHLCHKPTQSYRPDGNCRACMVEIEGERTLALHAYVNLPMVWLFQQIQIVQNLRERWL